MGKQMGFYVNQQVCMGCKTCQIACKDKNDLKVGQLWRRIYEVEGGGYTQVGPVVHSDAFAYYISISCNHCENPTCIKACPTGAMHKRAEDGVVMVNRDLCIGCKSCAWACPYGAPQYNPELGKMGKCDLCTDLRDQGKAPACVDACPMRAIEVAPLEELQAKHPEGTAALAGLAPATITNPAVLYTPHRRALTGEIGQIIAEQGRR